MGRRRWYLAIASAFAVHNLEEGLSAPLMLDFMQSRAPGVLRQFYQGISTSELRVSLSVLTVVGFALSLAAARTPQRPAWGYAMLVFASVLGLNALVHMTLSGVHQQYMPGLLTAVTVTLPLALMVLLHAHRHRWVPPRAYWTILPAAIVVHGPALVLFIRTTIQGWRALVNGAG